MTRIVVVGDALLDRDVEGDATRLSPDGPVPVVDERTTTSRAGGAGLAATLLARDGHRVVLVTAIGDDHAGGLLREHLGEAAVQIQELPYDGQTTEKTRIRAGGRTMLRVDRSVSGSLVGTAGPGAAEAFDTAEAVLVADYGLGVAAEAGLRRLIRRYARRRPVVWDPHPRGAVPVPGCTLVTPNSSEARHFVASLQDAGTDIARARLLRERWDAAGVALTLGGDGAVVVDGGGTPLRVPAVAATGHAIDTCGAGDRFSATAAEVLATGGLLSDAVVAAVDAASRFVIAGGASAVAYDPAAADGADLVDADPLDADSLDAVAFAEDARARGLTVVATGGCFDLLHAGHVRMLQAARSLGDCLVVCLNSDASVAARKGPGRPVMPAADRAAILRGLRCVDAVAVFDEPAPDAVLRKLRPHVWAKGADYTVADLPEAATVAEWGGDTVVLPYLAGRSTTQLLKEAWRHA